MTRPLPLFASLALLAAVPPALAESPDCEPAKEIDVARLSARALIVGELHGTAETPAFIARLTCSLLKAGRPVIVALEREGQEQPALLAYLASAGQPADVQALTAHGAWARPQQDGRNSLAMLAMLEQLRRLRAAGQPVGVLAMQQTFVPLVPLVPPGTAGRAAWTEADDARFGEINDRTMADQVWTTLATHPAYTVVALAGNMHTAIASASRLKQSPWPSFGDALAAMTPVQVIGLSSSGGSSWNMTTQGAGARRTMAGPLYLSDSRIDLQVTLGSLTASPPAVAPTNVSAATESAAR